MAEVREDRPVASGPAESISTAIKVAATSITPAALHHPRAIAPAFCVFTMHDDGRIKRRHVYVSLSSALKAMERAEAKGQRFELMLVELVPVAAKPVLVVEGGAA